MAKDSPRRKTKGADRQKGPTASQTDVKIEIKESKESKLSNSRNSVHHKTLKKDSRKKSVKSLKKKKRRKWTLTRKFKKLNRHQAKRSSGPLMFPYHLRWDESLETLYTTSILGRGQSSHVAKEKAGTIANFCRRNPVRTVPRSENFTWSLVA